MYENLKKGITHKIYRCPIWVEKHMPYLGVFLRWYEFFLKGFLPEDTSLGRHSNSFVIAIEIIQQELNLMEMRATDGIKKRA